MSIQDRLSKIEYQLLKNLPFVPSDEQTVAITNSILKSQLLRAEALGEDLTDTSTNPTTFLGATITWDTSNPEGDSYTIEMNGVTITQDADDPIGLIVNPNDGINDAEAVALDKQSLQIGLGTNPDLQNVTEVLSFPLTGSNSTTISWDASTHDGVDNVGAVSQPANGMGNATGTITATITKNAESDTKTFNVTVLESTASGTEFIMTVETTGDSEDFILPTGTGTFDYNVNWGDGTSENKTTANTQEVHTYATAGQYDITINGTFPHMIQGWSGNTPEKIIDVKQWGNQQWGSMYGMFQRCTNLIDFSATDVPNLNNVTNMSYVFRDATSFNDSIGDWDISNVTSMSSLFYNVILSTTNYDSLLNGWASQSVNSNFTIDLNESLYSSVGEAARNTLINTYGWTIIDGGIIPAPVTNFTTTFKTDNSGTLPADQLQLPISRAGIHNFTVDWGDGNTDTVTEWSESAITHTYTTPGTYDVTINGDFGKFGIGEDYIDARSKLVDVKNWGGATLKENGYQFHGCSNLTALSATDAPIINPETSMASGFENCSNFGLNVDNWNFSNVTNMSYMLSGCRGIINRDLSSWDVSNVTDMSYLFQYSNNFNGNISNWDTSSVINMRNMFDGVHDFNGDISSWDTSSATNMYQMFQNAQTFNQDINTKIINTGQPNEYTAWDVSNVTDMGNMFFQAHEFDQDLSGWNIGNVTIMSSLFYQVSLSTTNYDSLLNGWANLPQIPTNISFTGGLSVYSSAGEAARNTLINTYGWDIWDNGPEPAPVTNFTTTWKTDPIVSSYSKSNNNQIKLPMRCRVNYDFTVDWGDGNLDTITSRDQILAGETDPITHTYTTPGTYDITINGDFGTFGFLYFEGEEDNGKLVDVKNWGGVRLHNARRLFFRASSLVDFSAIDTPVLDYQTTLSDMFTYADNFNGDMSSWDVSNVTDMNRVFYEADSFNQDVSSWDVSNATTMQMMFYNSSFNQNLSQWDISNVTTLYGIFSNTNLSTVNYDAILNGWASLDVGEAKIPTSIYLSASGCTYSSAGETARNTLINTYGWTIQDGGLAA